MQIEVYNLSKCFKNKEVLNGISLLVEKNKITSLIGPNGSGKTTFFRCITDIYNYQGILLYDKKDFTNNKNKIKLNLCYIADSDDEELNLTVNEYLLLMVGLYDNKFNLEKYEILIEIYGVNPYLNEFIFNCSHGTIKKINLILSFMVSVELIILDEPFNGLDPEYTIITKKLINFLKNKNKTILLSCHNLSIVEEISDNILFLNDGKLKYSGSIDEFKNLHKISTLDESWLSILGYQSNIENAITKLSKFY